MDFTLGMIMLLFLFHGLESKNPYVHVRKFEEVLGTFYGQPNALDLTMLKFFPFSLKDKAKLATLFEAKIYKDMGRDDSSIL